jgi:hypothetical protein
MDDEKTRPPDETGDEGEPGRDEVAGSRGGQPGYDLDEAEAYEEAEEAEDGDA